MAADKRNRVDTPIGYSPTCAPKPTRRGSLTAGWLFSLGFRTPLNHRVDMRVMGSDSRWYLKVVMANHAAEAKDGMYFLEMPPTDVTSSSWADHSEVRMMRDLVCRDGMRDTFPPSEGCSLAKINVYSIN
jgi:hypothetical protein